MRVRGQLNLEAGNIAVEGVFDVRQEATVINHHILPENPRLLILTLGWISKHGMQAISCCLTPAAFSQAFAQVDLVSRRIKVSNSFVKLPPCSHLSAKTYLENTTVT